MRDSNEPEVFMHNYYHAISQYTHKTHHRHSKPLMSSAPWMGARKANAGMGAFIDDVIRVVVPQGNDDRGLASAANFDSRSLTDSLDEKSYVQNETKADVVLFARRW